MSTGRKCFASDNASGIHPAVLQAIVDANDGQAYPGYGNDPYTKRAIAKFKEVFGQEAEPFFVFNGTAANVLGIGAPIHF